MHTKEENDHEYDQDDFEDNTNDEQSKSVISQ